MTTIDMFKFQLGEIVQFKSAPNHIMLIVEQHLQICTGGQQRKYLVRPFKREKFGGIGDKYSLFDEMELELQVEKPKVDKIDLFAT